MTIGLLKLDYADTVFMHILIGDTEWQISTGVEAAVKTDRMGSILGTYGLAGVT